METPRTDKQTYIADRGVHLDTVPASFARQLEREHREMAQELDRLCMHIGVAMDNGVAIPGLATMNRTRAILERIGK